MHNEKKKIMFLYARVEFVRLSFSIPTHGIPLLVNNKVFVPTVEHP